MKLLLACIFVALCAIATVHTSCPETPPDLIESYRKHAFNLTLQAYKRSAKRTGYHFVHSSHLMWLTVAGMAEGADSPNQQKMFKVIFHPQNRTLREKFYEIAASRMSLSPYVKMPNKRGLMLDEDATPLCKWHDYVTEHSLLNVTSGPIKCDPKAAANKLRKLMSARLPKINLQGNSVMYDTIDFNGLWTDAFDDAVIKRSPFYNEKEERIGSVDLMTTRRRVHIGYLPEIHSKVIALNFGKNEEYFIIFAVIADDTYIGTISDNMENTIVRQSVDVLKYSAEPVYIAIPRFSLTSELNARTIMQDLGMKNLWTDPDASKYVSKPPALPGNYVQRTTVTFDKRGVNPPPDVPRPCDADDDDYYGVYDVNDDRFLKSVIANRPFMWGIFDNQTFSVIISGMYTRPTYPDPWC